MTNRQHTSRKPQFLFHLYIFYSSANQTMNSVVNSSGSVPSDVEILQEAKMLREHKGRLESRMKILEDHNLQLESQLGKLKMMLHEVCYYFIDNSDI